MTKSSSTPSGTPPTATDDAPPGTAAGLPMTAAPYPRPQRPQTGARREHLVVLLAFVSGSVDAIGFVALGGAFTSVMTGNLVLTGVAVARGDGALLARVGAAILAYITGCALGARVARSATPGREHWPSAVTRTLSVECGLLLIFGVGWWLSQGRPGEAEQLTLLAVNAAALGMQSAAVQRFGVPGLSTTYLTGTLTQLVIRMAARQPLAELRLNGLLLGALVLGGAAGAVTALHARLLAPAVPVAVLLLVLLAGRRLHISGPTGSSQ